VQNGTVALDFVSTKEYLSDLFTKALNEEQFNYIRKELRMGTLKDLNLQII